MRQRLFGRAGWPIGEVGYGMWGMGAWSGADDDESRQSLRRAVDLGCNFFDTAWAYGAGHSERLLGELLQETPATRIAEFALRWILSNPVVSVVIPGMRKPAHVAANLAASDAGPLPVELLAASRLHRWDRRPSPQPD